MHFKQWTCYNSNNILKPFHLVKIQLWFKIHYLMNKKSTLVVKTFIWSITNTIIIPHVKWCSPSLSNDTSRKNLLNHGLTMEYKIPKHVPYLSEQKSEKKVHELHKGIKIKLFKSSNTTIVQTKQELGLSVFWANFGEWTTIESHKLTRLITT